MIVGNTVDWPSDFKLGLQPDSRSDNGTLLDRALINHGFDLHPTKPLSHADVGRCLALKGRCPLNIYETGVSLICRRGHVTETAIFIQDSTAKCPGHWCPHEKCDGLNGAFNILLNNHRKSMYRDIPDHPSGCGVEVKCGKCNNTWITDKKTVLSGIFCDCCIYLAFKTDEDYQKLASRIGGRYDKETKTFYCYKGEALTSDILEMARGLKCSKHEECKSMRIMLSEGKNYENTACVLERLKLLAKLQGGDLLGQSETDSNKFEWICHGKAHEGPHKWIMSIDEFLFQSWCPICKPVVPTVVEAKKKLNRRK